MRVALVGLAAALQLGAPPEALELAQHAPGHRATLLNAHQKPPDKPPPKPPPAGHCTRETGALCFAPASCVAEHVYAGCDAGRCVCDPGYCADGHGECTEDRGKELVADRTLSFRRMEYHWGEEVPVAKYLRVAHGRAVLTDSGNATADLESATRWTVIVYHDETILLRNSDGFLSVSSCGRVNGKPSLCLTTVSLDTPVPSIAFRAAEAEADGVHLEHIATRTWLKGAAAERAPVATAWVVDPPLPPEVLVRATANTHVDRRMEKSSKVKRILVCGLVVVTGAIALGWFLHSPPRV